MADMPNDPFVPASLMGAMAAMYEMYAGARQSGFSEQQAMYIIAQILAELIKAPKKDA